MRSNPVSVSSHRRKVIQDYIDKARSPSDAVVTTQLLIDTSFNLPQSEGLKALATCVALKSLWTVDP